MEALQESSNGAGALASTSASLVNIEDIAARYKLTTFNTAAWRATRLHKRETREENERHNTGNAAKVLLRLTDHDALQAIYKLDAQAYREHKRLTVPSVQDGMRIIACRTEFTHAEVMSDLFRQRVALIDRFVADYPMVYEEAERKLNGLFDPTMWPDVGDIRERFGFWVRYLACPVEGEWKEWLEESARAADAEVKERIEEALKRVAERCGNLDGKLYQTVFGNLRELLDLVPDLDVFGKYAEVVKEAREISVYTADDLKDDKGTREYVAKRAEEILGIFGKLA